MTGAAFAGILTLYAALCDNGAKQRLAAVARKQSDGAAATVDGAAQAERCSVLQAGLLQMYVLAATQSCIPKCEVTSVKLEVQNPNGQWFT